jgi:hypothetical protein
LAGQNQDMPVGEDAVDIKNEGADAVKFGLVIHD